MNRVSQPHPRRNRRLAATLASVAVLAGCAAGGEATVPANPEGSFSGGTVDSKNPITREQADSVVAAGRQHVLAVLAAGQTAGLDIKVVPIERWNGCESVQERIIRSTPDINGVSYTVAVQLHDPLKPIDSFTRDTFIQNVISSADGFTSTESGFAEHSFNGNFDLFRLNIRNPNENLISVSLRSPCYFLQKNKGGDMSVDEQELRLGFVSREWNPDE